MIECGKVTKIVEDRATVSFLRHTECDRCQLCKVGKDGRSVEITLKNSLDVNVGDYVRVELFKKKTRIASVLLYILPLVLTALGAGLGLLASVAASIILAFLGVVVGLAFAVPIDVCVVRKNDGYKPKMLEICTETDYLKSIERQTNDGEDLKANNNNQAL